MLGWSLSRAFAARRGRAALPFELCRRAGLRTPLSTGAARYEEAAGWNVGEPLDGIDRGAGWSIYKGPLLDDLEKQIFPDITLSGDYGTSAATLNHLLATSSRFWSFGSNFVQTVFDAGARSAQFQEARAVFDQDVANYRQTVLTASQSKTSSLRCASSPSRRQSSTGRVAAAREAERIINNQYLAGTVAYTSVIVAEQTALADAETAVNIARAGWWPAPR